MKLYLKSISRQLKNYSLSLDKTSILLDKPWALIDEELEMQKLIFKKNNELVLSKNGTVEKGRWEYFPEVRSLLIDRNSDKILCNEAFIDEGIMILKLDGTDNKYFTLANENIVTDLDIDTYLKKLRRKKLHISEIELTDGRILELSKNNGSTEPQVGDRVSIDAQSVEDGKYSVPGDSEYSLATDGRQVIAKKKPEYLEVKDGKVFRTLTARRYFNLQGDEVTIHQQDDWYIRTGDYVYVSGEKPTESKINLSKSQDILLEDGRVTGLIERNLFAMWLSEKWDALRGYFGK